jgi:glycosyltransferase involved in cell wall biosynthesis
MRILMLTQWFNPEPVFKGLTFAKELARRGHEVEVLTGFPNYPGGEIYDGYRNRLYQREVMDGIPILRVPIYPSHDSSSFKRILNYGSFALSAATIGAALVKPADVMYVYQPITIGFAAAVIKHIRRVPFVIDIQDLWPDYLPATGMINNPKALWMIDLWCRFVYREANKVTVLSPGFRKSLVERGVPPEKVEVIYNWCDEDQVDLSKEPDEELARSTGMNGRFNIVFAGTMGKAQALDSVLDAARIVAAKYPQIQFVFIGGGVEVPLLKSRAMDMGLTNTLFLPRRPLSEIGQLLKLADVQLIHLKDDPLFSTTVPSKTQTSLAVGRPILMGVRGDAASLVEAAKAGISCNPQDPHSIAEAVSKLFEMPRTALEEMGRNARQYYFEELSLKVGVDKFEAIFSEIQSGAHS